MRLTDAFLCSRVPASLNCSPATPILLCGFHQFRKASLNVTIWYKRTVPRIAKSTRICLFIKTDISSQNLTDSLLLVLRKQKENICNNFPDFCISQRLGFSLFVLFDIDVIDNDNTDYHN